MKIIEAFEGWLIAQGYQPSTVRSTIRMTKRAEKAWRDGLDISSYTPYLKRLVAFAKERQIREEFIEAIEPMFDAVVATPFGSSEKPSLTDSQWQALVSRLDVNDPYDAALNILLRLRDPATELQELVQMPLTQLERREMPLHTLRAIRDIRRVGVGSILSFVCPGGSYACAYKRLARRLASRGRELQIELDFHNVARTPWEVRMG